jgi:S-adenosylmethionine hydrolase
MRSNTIALLTDFGTKDGYVGVMKAVMKNINSRVDVIDISHDIAPQNVNEAAFVLWNSYRYFPHDTVFVIVIDPGVGSRRRILCVRTNDYMFLAPDNGVLRYVVGELHIRKVVEVTNTEYFLPQVSTTFHGRDIFAPVAAHVARGLRISLLGKAVSNYGAGESLVKVDPEGGKFSGKIIHIDRFGNLITNVKMPSRGISRHAPTIKIGKVKIHGLAGSYSEGKEGSPIALIGGSGLLEIAVKNGSAGEQLKLSIGDEVVLSVAKELRP